MVRFFSQAVLIMLLTILCSLPVQAMAEAPSGFSSTTLALSAQVNISCQEARPGSFPSPMTIDTLSSTDQTFSSIADEMVRCTNGTVFTIKVASANGTAVEQTCTSSGVSGMAFKSASVPADNIQYTFLCAGDTNGSGNFTGAGFSTPRALGIGIKVAVGAAQVAMAHNDYADTATLTISY